MTQSLFTRPYCPNGWTTQRFADANRRPSEFINWHFGSDGARHGLKTVHPANGRGTAWYWNYTRKRWDIYIIGNVECVA